MYLPSNCLCVNDEDGKDLKPIQKKEMKLWEFWNIPCSRVYRDLSETASNVL